MAANIATSLSSRSLERELRNLCAQGHIPQNPLTEVLHRLPDSLPSAGQNSAAYWRLSSWMLSGRSRLLGNLGCELVAERSRIYDMKEFHSVTVQKWRVSTPKTSCRFQLWRWGKMFQSQWRGISICFYLTSVCDCGTHFSKGCHTELRVLTLVILNPVMTNPRFQGPPDIFLMRESTLGLIFWFWELKKFSMVSLGVCSQSLKTWIGSNTCLHEAFPVMLDEGKGTNHNSEPGLPQSLWCLGFILSDL